MIQLIEIVVHGTSELGPFAGSFDFEPGLQVVVADNHFGKSLAVTSIAWCLGLERMFGLQDNDPSRFPVAVREVAEFGGQVDVPVLDSFASVTMARADGAMLRLTRPIRGDASKVRVEELNPAAEVITESVLLARKHTMKDETGGLQRFLFEWFGMPRMQVVNNSGDEAEIYLENLAPLFFIDQNEGWTDLQSLQVHRYGLLEISDIAVEYLLGATAAIETRFKRQLLAARDAKMKAEASAIAGRVNTLFRRNGWVISWSDHGSVDAIAKRWGQRSLSGVLKTELGIDLHARQQELEIEAVRLRTFLATGSLDPKSAAAASDASQKVVELKNARHQRREDLRVLRRQKAEQSELLSAVVHRLQSARDVLRLKLEGIGRLQVVECPTCHKALDAATFALSSQSAEGVQSHIDALNRDRQLLVGNIESTEDQVIRVAADLATIEAALREAEVGLAAVNQSVGSSREQLTKTATDLVSVEGEVSRVGVLRQEIGELEARVEDWITNVSIGDVEGRDAGDLERRKREFISALRALLGALGHGAILSQPHAELHLDEHYVPYLGSRRLRSLGSASDHSRLVAAYVLALAAASGAVQGLHPGFVVLDEPLQQNPDKRHRKLFIEFLSSDTADALHAQTIVFTWLDDAELHALKESGVRVVNPASEHFLKLLGAGSDSDAPAGAAAPD